MRPSSVEHGRPRPRCKLGPPAMGQRPSRSPRSRRGRGTKPTGLPVSRSRAKLPLPCARDPGAGRGESSGSAASPAPADWPHGSVIDAGSRDRRAGSSCPSPRPSSSRVRRRTRRPSSDERRARGRAGARRADSTAGSAGSTSTDVRTGADVSDADSHGQRRPRRCPAGRRRARSPRPPSTGAEPSPKSQCAVSVRPPGIERAARSRAGSPPARQRSSPSREYGAAEVGQRCERTRSPASGNSPPHEVSCVPVGVVGHEVGGARPEHGVAGGGQGGAGTRMQPSPTTRRSPRSSARPSPRGGRARRAGTPSSGRGWSRTRTRRSAPLGLTVGMTDGPPSVKPALIFLGRGRTGGRAGRHRACRRAAAGLPCTPWLLTSNATWRPSPEIVAWSGVGHLLAVRRQAGDVDVRGLAAVDEHAVVVRRRRRGRGR